MPIIAIIAGALLDAIGLIGYFATGQESWTALIPSIFGTVLALCGILSLVRPPWKKHFMHVAAAFGLLGILGSARGLMALPAMLGGAEVARPAAVWAQSATAVVCLVFVGLCVQSFIKARRARGSGGAA